MRKKLTFERLQKLRRFGESLHELREKGRDKKTQRLQLRVTPSEKSDVLIMCDRFGISVSDYLMHLHREAQAEVERQIAQDEMDRQHADLFDEAVRNARDVSDDEDDEGDDLLAGV